MKKIGIAIVGLCLLLLVGIFVWEKWFDRNYLYSSLQPTPIPTPLTVYSFPNLAHTTFPPAPLTLGAIVKTTPESTEQLFTYTFAPRPGSKEMKTVSGVINLPKSPGTYPIIYMVRGYIPPENFFSGAGTQPAASVFVKHGYITIAPDFLGFGGSDPKASDEYEARFQTYTTALSLFYSLPNLNVALDASYSGTIRADSSKVGIWGHSNGGHIALSLLAITGTKDPTVLWAPVSKSFPYSVLAFTDEDDDLGKGSRRSLANFEKIYDTSAFDPSQYYSWIQAPIQLHQGTADQEVPYWWSDELAAIFKKNGTAVDYIKHPGADHNLRPSGWSDAVQESLDFYAKNGIL